LKTVTTNFKKPILKWSGRKYPLLNSIINNIPENSNGTYFEPFLGSASVFLNVVNNKSFEKYVLNDSLNELVLMYTSIRDTNVNQLSDALNMIESSYNNKKSQKSRESFYYEKRNEYNALLKKRKLNKVDSEHLTTILLFLNKTCFNGVYRKNSSGEFNVPHGRRASSNQKVNLVTADELALFSKKLTKASIYSKDYKEILPMAKKNDFIYLDPPYVKTVNYYGVEKFDEHESMELKQEIDKLTSRNVRVLMSNSNTEMTKDIFINKNYFYKELSATRTIERRSLKKNNKTSNELLIANFKLI
jgi:DNA adenine methylase